VAGIFPCKATQFHEPSRTTTTTTTTTNEITRFRNASPEIIDSETEEQMEWKKKKKIFGKKYSISLLLFCPPSLLEPSAFIFRKEFRKFQRLSSDRAETFGRT
jgi:hypothetical protein